MFKLERLKKADIKKYIEKGDLDAARIALEEYKKLNSYDMEFYCMKSIIEFLCGNYKEAENYLISIYYKYEFNFDINYNLGVIYIYQEKYIDAVKYLIKASIIDSSRFEIVQNMLMDIPIKDLEDKTFDEIKEEVYGYFSNYKRNFPRKNEKELYIGKEIKLKEKSYYCGIYDYYFPERDGLLLNYNSDISGLFKTEILPGRKVRDADFKIKNKSILPIMKLKQSEISVFINNDKYNLNNNLVNRFYYYPLEKDTNVIINSKEEFVIGDIIQSKVDKSKPKLILNIFVDGLSQKFLKDNGFEEYMPNTYNFFREGTICNNSYVSGEWTYVSMASFFTGEYTKNHRVFQPDYDTENIFNKKLYSEILKENGYFCSRIDGDWRSTPTYGYVKGLDRFLYQPSIRGMHSDNVIVESIEHLEAFKEKNNFLWICIPDLHDIADEFETRLSTQVKSYINNRVFEKTNETSVKKKYDSNKIERYGAQLKRIDTYLQILFNYIKDNYSNDEFIISLFADHGQGYLINTDEFLDEGRTNVAMMFRGKNIPKGQCNELIQGLDLFPIILNSIGIDNEDIKDGNIPKYFGGNKEREYTITESVFPNNPYRIAINDLEHKFFFNTKHLCTKDGRVKLEDFNVRLVNKLTNKDETNLYRNKTDKYTDIAINHIREFIIIDDCEI
ncbi:sulfatase-like hydrolase/transferase [Clostridium sporogenes]|uniref:Sulfatase-like hydrolase/transferase n=1 Tax=Clostridium sporogenes TaxID=1509 RepID=A0AAE4FKC0_CLOSG|nr:sulfatase-like hydrolase/transferase [Clostridium sporogenes]MDS1002885.1 sulfatase-like hydrolase/transferase [Clostridium sporogenes]